MSEGETKRRYPLVDRVPGWFFRVEEISPGAWRVDGTDLYGRTVGAPAATPMNCSQNAAPTQPKSNVVLQTTGGRRSEPRAQPSDVVTHRVPFRNEL
jgi:hypothetical protein